MRIKFGTYSGNGGTKAVTGVGFQPDLVLVCSINGQSDSLFKTDKMSGVNSLGLRLDAGNLTDGITAFGADGFTLGANTLGNNNGSTYVYMAVEDDGSGDFGTFSYTGDGADNHAITGLGFAPTFAMLKGIQSVTGCFRFGTAGSNSTSIFYTDQNQSGLVKTLDSDGLTLGTSSIANANGVVFHGFAFKKVDGRAFCFTYTGNGSDSQNKVQPGFPLGFAILKSRGSSDEHVFRMAGHSGDNSQPFTGAQGANKIQTFSSILGFQVGTDATVNGNTKTYDAFVLYDPTQTIPTLPTADYSQPAFPTRTRGWSMNGIDFQVVTKQSAWNQDQTKRLNEFQAAKNIGANFASLAVPYNDATKYGNYVTDARTKGLKLWHRSHWNEWEGDNSAASGLSAQYYLDRTYNFIVDNPTFFANGDWFGMCVECNNANDAADNKAYPFRVGNLTGGAFSLSLYKQFMFNQIRYANAAFLAIGKSVMTAPISVSVSLLDLAGQNLDGTSGISGGLNNAEVVANLGGILCIDHYLSDAYRATSGYGAKFSSDLDKLHIAFPDCVFVIGEWGYHTTTSITDREQYEVYREIAEVLASKSFVKAVNWWVHMASNTASIFADSGGTINPTGRLATQAIAAAFRGGNAAYGRPVRA